MSMFHWTVWSCGWKNLIRHSVRHDCRPSWCNQIMLKTLTGGFIRGLGLPLTEQSCVHLQQVAWTKKQRETYKAVSLQTIISGKSQQDTEVKELLAPRWPHLRLWKLTTDLPLCFHIDSNNSKPKPSAAWCRFALIKWLFPPQVPGFRNDFRVLLTDINSDFSFLWPFNIKELLDGKKKKKDWLI